MRRIVFPSFGFAQAPVRAGFGCRLPGEAILWGVVLVLLSILPIAKPDVFPGGNGCRGEIPEKGGVVL